MENAKIEGVVKKLNTGKERKDLMILKVDSMCNWEQFLMPASTSIAILGQLMAIATKKDFSLDKKRPEGGFKFVKHPGSFRACLVQISNSGCEAFMKAHKSMDKIRMYTMLFRENIAHAVDILIKGSEEEKSQILPGMFEEMKNDADKCLHLAEETESKFYHVVLLIDETSEASAAVKGVYEESLKEALEKMKVLQMEEQLIETRKREMEDEKKRVIEELGAAKAAFDKSINQVPGVGTILAMNTIEEGLKIAIGALNLIGPYKLAGTIAGGITTIASTFKRNVGEKLKPPNQSDNETLNGAQHQHELKVAYEHANTIHTCIELMYKMFSDSTDSNGRQDKKIDLDEHKCALDEIRDTLVGITDNIVLSFKEYEFAKNKTTIETNITYKKGIEICEEMLQIKMENADELFQKVEKLKSESKGLQLRAHHIFQHSSFSIPGATTLQTDKESQSKRTSEIASENARYAVELRRKELDDAKRAREQLHDEVRKMDEKQNSILDGLSKTRIENINFEEIQITLKEGLTVLSQLKKQWSFLVLFFQNITSEIDVCLSQKTYKLDRILGDGRYSVGQITRDIVLEMAASVNSVAYAVELIATAYTDISKKHLVPNTASLVELIAYDPEKEGEQLDRKRRQIDEDCKEAKDEIKALAEKSRNDLEQKVEGMYKRLEEQLNKLPPLTQEKVQEIKENVEKSNMSESDYI